MLSHKITSSFVLAVWVLAGCYGGIAEGGNDVGIATLSSDGTATEGGHGADDTPTTSASAGGATSTDPSAGPSGGDPSGDPSQGDPSGDPSGTASNSGPDGGSTDSSDTGDTNGDDMDGGDTDEPPPPIVGGCNGYATRYWDCCKAHCGWEGNVPAGMDPLTSCNQADASQGNDYDAPSSCNQATFDASYTCHSLAPWAVGASLAYGFAAVPGGGDICGRCYQLEFAGTSHNGGADPGSAALGGKTMIVQAINIGFDVAGGQFDLLIPGGGTGAFDACTAQLGVASGELGQTYGGILAQCKQDFGFAGTLAQYKNCVSQQCASVFAGHGDLLDGCAWFVDWFEVADNPNLLYQEIACPNALIGSSGMDRTFLDDVSDAC